MKLLTAILNLFKAKERVRRYPMPDPNNITFKTVSND